MQNPRSPGLAELGHQAAERLTPCMGRFISHRTLMTASWNLGPVGIVSLVERRPHGPLRFAPGCRALWGLYCSQAAKCALLQSAPATGSTAPGNAPQRALLQCLPTRGSGAPGNAPQRALLVLPGCNTCPATAFAYHGQYCSRGCCPDTCKPGLLEIGKTLGGWLWVSGRVRKDSSLVTTCVRAAANCGHGITFWH